MSTTSVLEKMGSHQGLRALFERAQCLELPRNQVLIQEGELPGHLYLLLSGRVSIRHPDPGGQDLLLGYCYAGDFFGEMGLFPGVDARSAMITTVNTCTALKIAYSEFIRLSNEHPALWLELAGQLAERLRSTNHRLARMPTLHAAERVWSVIEDMTRRMPATSSGCKVIHITRKDLGRMAGCSRELTGMIVADFAREGRLRMNGRAIIVPAPAA